MTSTYYKELSCYKWYQSGTSPSKMLFDDMNELISHLNEMSPKDLKVEVKKD